MEQSAGPVGFFHRARVATLLAANDYPDAALVLEKVRRQLHRGEHRRNADEDGPSVGRESDLYRDLLPLLNSGTVAQVGSEAPP